MSDSTPSLETLAQTLEASGDYRITRRFQPKDQFAEPPPDVRLLRLAVIDSETTGLDAEQDKVIELGYVIASFDPLTGQVYRVESRHSSFEDPGFPLPEHIKALTGLTDDDVRGQRFDDARIEAELSTCALIVAHNAPFDRGFLERRFPFLSGLWWACSQRECPWKIMQTGSTKLEWLMHQLLGRFYDAHRALIDAEVLLSILAEVRFEDAPVLRYLLQESKKLTFRVWANHSPYDKKDTLKQKLQYRWSDGTDPTLPFKAWYKDGVTDLDAELAALTEHVYSTPSVIQVDASTGRERYTARYAERHPYTVGAGE
ncbi:MAG: 3'-5' exonuclease [Dechloromonas sp.]|nr:3'-5' exonuclease [Dechloromonas sp.]